MAEYEYKIVLIPGRGLRAPVPIIKREEAKVLNGNDERMEQNRSDTERLSKE